MVSAETHIRVIKILIENPDATYAKIAELTGLSASTAHTAVEEIKTMYTEKKLAEEEDIAGSMAANYNGAVSREEMDAALVIISNRSKKFNNKQESNSSTLEFMDSGNNSSYANNGNPGLEIDSNVKALQFVLSKFKTNKVSEERINNLIQFYRAAEFKYKENPLALRPLFTQLLGEGLGGQAFQEFVDLVKYYVPPDQALRFGAGQGQRSAGVDPNLMNMMMAGGDINPMALMAGAQQGSGNFLEQFLMMEFIEERKRKREREERERREEAENQRFMNMMMASMMNKQDNNSQIPPGFTIIREYKPDGSPVDHLVPITQANAGSNNNGGNNSAEMFKAIAEIVPKLIPQQPAQNPANEFMTQIAVKAMDKLNVQTDPLESAARVMEVVERFRPQGQTEVDPYGKVKAEIEMLDKKMQWVEKQREWDERILDKKMAQENTKGYIETIERVVTNIGSPLVEKFSQGLLNKNQGVPATYPTQQAAAAASQQVNEEEYFNSLSPEQLEAIAAQRDANLADFNKKNAALEKALASKRGLNKIEQPEGGQQQGSSSGGYYVNTGGDDSA